MRTLKNKIGLEIHTTLNTKTKLFCSCPNRVGQKPNTDVCEICLGHPGSKPSPNEEAVRQIVRLAKYFNCEIRKDLVFSRKSYFYPDLAKNFQITQFEEPIAKNGYVEIKGHKIRIKRIHLEEDPASITKQNGKTLLNYNRSGTPLAEIVTEPDIKDSEQARKFMNKVLTYLKYAKTYDKQRSLIKADVNVSSKKHNYLRAEVKNVSGFKDIQLAIDYEIKRQKQEVVKNQETRGWNAKKQITTLMREKESESDYGYIYEPDITPIALPKSMYDMTIGDKPEAIEKKLVKQGVAEDDAKIISSDPDIATFFEETILHANPKHTSNILRTQLLQILDYNEINIEESKITPKHFADTINMYVDEEINDKVVTKLLRKLVTQNMNPVKFVEENGLKQIKNETALQEFAKQAIQENSESVADYKKGEEKALNYLVGQVMRKSKGKANPQKAKRILKKLLT